MATDVERLAVVVEANTRQFNNAMKRMERNISSGMNNNVRHVKKLNDSFNRLDSKIIAVGKTFARGFLAGGAIAAARGLGSAIGGVVDEVSNLVDTADKVGISVETLQELRFAAEQTGVETRTLDMAMQRFSRRVGEVANGTGELKATFERLGIEVRDSAGNMRSQVDLLGDLANAIRDAGSQQERLSIAFKAFDSEGAALVNTLMAGSNELHTNMQRARDLGTVLDEELARSAKAVGEDFDALTTIIATQFKRGVLSTVDAVKQLADALTAVEDKTLPFLRDRLAILKAGREEREFLSTVSGLPTAQNAAAEGLRLEVELQEQINEILSRRAQLVRASERQFGSGDVSTSTSSSALSAISIVPMLRPETVNNFRRLSQEINHNTTALGNFETQFQKTNSVADLFGQTVFDALDSLILRGEDAEDVMKRLAVQIARAALQASLLGTGPLSGIFGGGARNPIANIGGGAGGLLGFLSSLIPGGADGGQIRAFASGGPVSGPGSGRSDNIPAMLSNGEFVVNAVATKKHSALLHAMNSGGKIKPVSKNAGVVVNIENYGTNKDFTVDEGLDGRIRIIANDVATAAVRRDSGSVVAAELQNPNSRSSKAMQNNFKLARNRA